MIHHVSIPAREPRRVAEVLAELMGGQCQPFGPLEGAYMATSGDEHGSMIEVYPDETLLTFEDGDEQVFFEKSTPPRSWPFHVLLSVALDEATVHRIGQREGWRAKTFGRGAPGQAPFFHVIEFWLENRLMLEVATPAMAAEYKSFLQTGGRAALDEATRQAMQQSHLHAPAS